MKAADTSTRQPNLAAVRGARKWLLRDAIREYWHLLASYGQSIAEAAYQGDDSLIRIHLRSNQLVLKSAVDAFRELAALSNEDTSAEKKVVQKAGGWPKPEGRTVE